jgi:arylamine N-acetyltransferase
VTLETGEKYAVDVGFGGDGPTKPLPLVVHKVHTNLGAQEIRYDYASIAQFQSDCRFWIYQYRNGKDREWLPYYCFSETPYLREDFDIMNYYSSSPANKNQNANILLVKFMRTGSQITGKRTVFNNIVKENTGGKSKVLVNCKNEEERIEAFKEHFGIILLEEERNGIKGRVTELPS